MIHVFLGTKAQLIKMAPLMRELQDRGIEYNFIWSGQHRETIDDLRANFGVKAPDTRLYEGRDIVGMVQMAIWAIRLVIKALTNRQSVWRGDRRGVVLVHGDTFSTLLGAILARICGHQCFHVEAGLRSFNYFHPFPEELTRVAVFRLSQVLYAPGEWAVENLMAMRAEVIDTRANTLLDALRMIASEDTAPESLLPEGRFAVVSIHRFENIYKREQLERIISLVESAAETVPLLFILHAPTRKRLDDYGLATRLENNPNIELRPRYDYLTFIRLIMHAEFIITDGGSNQEECSYLGLPCLLMRRYTERQEGLGDNAVISGYDPQVVADFVAGYRERKGERKLDSVSPSGIIAGHLERYR